MTEYELLQESASLGAVALYMTVVSGYLVVAYSVGAKLSRFQVIFVSVIFTFFCAFTIWGSTAYFHLSIYYADLSKSSTVNVRRFLGIPPAAGIGILEFLGLVGSLAFMRDVRKSK